MSAQSNGGSPETVITVRELTKVFSRFTAVDHLTFDVHKGEIFGFLGPNGAGKSTTIRMLCGLLQSTEGTATVGGHDINREPERVRENIGYMSQKFSLYKDLTVMENIRFFGGVYGLEGKRLQERANAIVSMCRMEGVENTLTRNLSGAVQQRLALGCAVLHEPPILFLDEPTSGVDPISRRFFWDLIQNMAASGVTILITTHFMDEAEFCGRIGFISAGKLVALNTPGAIKHDAVREDLFEVSLPSFHGARERIDGIDGVVASSFFGPRLHVFCRRNEYKPDQLAAAIRKSGTDVDSVRAVPVSLEDTFIRLVQKQAEDAA